MRPALSSPPQGTVRLQILAHRLAMYRLDIHEASLSRPRQQDRTRPGMTFSNEPASTSPANSPTLRRLDGPSPPKARQLLTPASKSLWKNHWLKHPRSRRLCESLRTLRKLFSHAPLPISPQIPRFSPPQNLSVPSHPRDKPAVSSPLRATNCTAHFLHVRLQNASYGTNDRFFAVIINVGTLTCPTTRFRPACS